MTENWVGWAIKGKSPLVLEKYKNQRKFPKQAVKWFCPKCDRGPFVGAGIKKHREECKQ